MGFGLPSVCQITLFKAIQCVRVVNAIDVHQRAPLLIISGILIGYVLVLLPVEVEFLANNSSLSDYHRK